MALIKCPECGREISDAAPACPHCGYPLGESKPTVDAVPHNSTPPVEKKSRLPFLFGIAAVVVIVIVAGVFISNHRKLAAAQAAREEYINNLFSAVDLMFDGGTKIENTVILIHDVWYNTIYQKTSRQTNKYTIKSSLYKETTYAYPKTAFNDDFNTSLRNLYKSDEYSDAVSVINTTSSKISSLYGKLQNPPEDLSYCLSPLNDMYDAYIGLATCATDPSGSLTTYTSKFNDLSSDFIAASQKLSAIVLELKAQ